MSTNVLKFKKLMSYEMNYLPMLGVTDFTTAITEARQQQSQQTSSGDIPQQPYVSVRCDGVTYDLHLSPGEGVTMGTTNKLREVVRIVLQKFFTIPQLRELSLSGRNSKGEPKPLLPPHVVQLIVGNN